LGVGGWGGGGPDQKKCNIKTDRNRKIQIYIYGQRRIP
jgi:hypothetical protein